MEEPKYVTVCEDGTIIRTDRRGVMAWKDVSPARTYPHNRAERRRIVSKFRKERRP